MPQGHYALILLAGTALIACPVVSQEAQHTPADGRGFRIYQIYLAGTPGKPLSIKVTATEQTLQWVEEWVRDQEGRVWGRIYLNVDKAIPHAPREEQPGKLPPLAYVWLFDAGAGKITLCSVADRECQVNENHLPYTISFFAVGGNSTFCMDPVCQVPEQHERVQCGEDRLGEKFLGEYQIGGIRLARTSVMCYKPDGSGGGVDLWHNSEFDIYFGVSGGLLDVAKYYRIDQISSSVARRPEPLPGSS
jgi:hypothetical protein